MAGGFGWDRWAPWKGFRYTVTEKQKDTTRENWHTKKENTKNNNTEKTKTKMKKKKREI